jgi:hypothetical protein
MMSVSQNFDLARLRSEADRLGVPYDIGHGGIVAARDLQQRLAVRAGQIEAARVVDPDAEQRVLYQRIYDDLIRRRVGFSGFPRLYELAAGIDGRELAARLHNLPAQIELENLPALKEMQCSLQMFDDWLRKSSGERFEELILGLAARVAALEKARAAG